MTVIIPAALSAPDFFLPVLSTDLALDWHASDLIGSVADGGSVTSWASRAADLSATHGTFAYADGDWTFPTLDADGCNGAPCVTLGPTSRFKTYSGTGGVATGITSFTVSLVAKFNDPVAFQNSNAMRLLYGSNSGGQIPVIRPSGANRVFWGTTAASVLNATLPSPTGWKIWTISVDGVANTGKLRVSGLSQRSGAITAGQAFRGLCLGMLPQAALPGTPAALGLGMSVAAIRGWSRTLRDIEIEAQHSIWAAEFGIAA